MAASVITGAAYGMRHVHAVEFVHRNLKLPGILLHAE